MSETPDKKSYKDTLNLPQTSFAMEAKLVTSEPQRLAKWQAMNLYQKVLDAHKSDPKWVLHDGPPFANGDIHIGHVINKTLKDVVIRFRTMQGHYSPYVPGWDCHGLPIEHKIQEKLGSKIREMTVSDVRKQCFDYAMKFAGIQSEQFQRLGILGDWANPYLTMQPTYEAATLEAFAKFVEADLVFKKLKPGPWSILNQTALADAELEYKDVEDPSVYVEFAAENQPELRKRFGLGANDDIHFIIWTTTPWTLPANLAIAVHPEVEYAFVPYTHEGRRRVGVVAKDLVNGVFKDRAGLTFEEPTRAVVGSELAQLTYTHPFAGRIGKILPALYVTTTDGTGLVHTAPGHGEDDYITGINNGLDVYCPVMANGKYDDTVPDWIRGLNVFEANPLIVTKLRELGALLAEVKILHSYPHDWRSKKPVITRATEQWFIAVDKPFVVDQEGASSARTLRDRAREAVDKKIEFIPDWGKARMLGMLESRPDWCVSRQRAWGLPIPVFYNDKGEALLTPQSVRAVAARFAEKGSDAWFTDSPADLLGKDFGYPPGFSPSNLRKEKDIFDVWFESGTSWNAVLRKRSDLCFPCDLYLEGSDQHRGWFQLSLLPSLGATGLSPFKQVLTHGFVVKPNGEKVSKADKEYVTATKEINTHGADLLRLWTCSNDYQGDIRSSPAAIQKFGDQYRKIRNTLRYLLSNLYDFDASSAAPEIPHNSLDGWAMDQTNQLIREVRAAYESYQLHRVFRLLHDFCTVQVSAVYGNAMKDRLYCEAPDSPLRRRTQAVMHRMVSVLTKFLAPMIVFTADEVWEHIPHRTGDDANLPSVHLARFPEVVDQSIPDDVREEWRLLLELRDQGLLQLDALKKEILDPTKKDVAKYKPLDAEIIYQIDDDAMRRRLQAYGPDLEDLVGVGCHSFAEKSTEGPSVTVKVVDRRANYKACARSWKRRPDVGEDPQFPDLSLRDAAAVKALSK